MLKLVIYDLEKVKLIQMFLFFSLFISDNPRQTTRVPVFIKVLDVNDNAPEFAMSYDTFVCENVKAGQVFKTLCSYCNDLCEVILHDQCKSCKSKLMAEYKPKRYKGSKYQSLYTD